MPHRYAFGPLYTKLIAASNEYRSVNAHLKGSNFREHRLAASLPAGLEVDSRGGNAALGVKSWQQQVAQFSRLENNANRTRQPNKVYLNAYCIVLGIVL